MFSFKPHIRIITTTSCLPLIPESPACVGVLALGSVSELTVRGRQAEFSGISESKVTKTDSWLYI